MINGANRCDLGAGEGEIQAAYQRLEKLRQSSPTPTCAEEMESLEREIQGQTNELARLIIEHHVQQALQSEALKEAERQFIGALPGKLKNEGVQAVRICPGSVLRITARASYYRRRCDRRKQKRSQGVYAGLVLLGIHERCTPLLGSRVSMMSALLSSFQEAKQVLFDQGIELGVKVIRKLAYRYAARARVVQQSTVFCLEEDIPIKGRRIAVSCDGGKTRLRENKRGPKTKQKRTRYKGAWREPKLLIIYVLDEQGKAQGSFAPVIDGSLNGPDAVFGLIQSYLRPLALRAEDQLLFVADGALWIWNRVPGLVKALGLDPQQVHELVDFYHAVEHLGKVAGLRKNWSVKQRKAWVKTPPPPVERARKPSYRGRA